MVCTAEWTWNFEDHWQVEYPAEGDSPSLNLSWRFTLYSRSLKQVFSLSVPGRSRALL